MGTTKAQRHHHSRLVRKHDGSTVQRPASLRSLRDQLQSSPDDLSVRVELAELLLARGKMDELIALLEPVRGTMAQSDPLSRRAARTYGFALARTGRFDGLRPLLEPLLADCPEAVDFLYLLADGAHQKGSFVQCEKYARAFLDQCERPADPSLAVLRTTATLRHEVTNYLGVALEETGRVNEALAAYESAIELRRSYEPAWLNLIRLLSKVGRSADARAVGKLARAACPRSRALARLRVGDQPAAAPRPTITLCMIVKNEEEHLPRCLQSVKGLADQIVVVDTGSTDRTVEIARSFGAVVQHHAWEGDFSKARNISMGYADNDWILILDADEEFCAADVDLVRRTISDTRFKAMAVSVYNYSAEKRMYTSFLPSIRLFRRDLGAYYEGIVHNQLRFPSPEGVLRIPARINHYGYGLSPEIMARKVARTKALLQQQLDLNPDNGFAHFNMAQLLRGEPTSPTPEMIERVIYHAGRAVDLTSPDDPRERHVHLMALHQLVTGYFNKADYPRAAAHAHRALGHKPGYLDAILSLGHIHSLDGQLDLARRYYLEYLDRQQAYDEHAETDHVILLHLRSKHNALYGLGLVAEMQNDPREAVIWYGRCIAERDDYLDAHFRLARLRLLVGDRESGRAELVRELALRPQNSDARLMLAELFEQDGREKDLRVCLEAGLEVDPGNVDCRLRLAQVDRRSGRYESALAHLEPITIAGPSQMTALRLRADILYDARCWEEAMAIYPQCLAGAPADPAILNNLGNCHFQLGQFAGAEAHYRRVIEAGQAEPSVYRNLGVSLLRQGRQEDAIFALESYLQLAPDDSQTVEILGDLQYERGDLARAIDRYEMVLERSPQRPDLFTRLGDCYLRRGATEAALAGYEAALSIDPEFAAAWDRLRELRAYLAAQMTGGQGSAGEEDDSEVETPAAVSVS